MTGTFRSKMSHIAVSLVAAGTLSLMTSSPVSAADEAQIHGKTYGEWSAGWWQWQETNYPDFSFGEGEVDCSLGQSGPVWFLGGTSGGSATRTCEDPLRRGTHLFIPLVNISLYNPDDNCAILYGDENCTVEQKREIIDGVFSEDPAGVFTSVACDLQIYVDGTPAVFSTPIVRTQSPPFNYAGDPETVSDGLWVMLKPLPSGDHTIHFTGGLCDISDPDLSLFFVDVIYNVSVK